MKSSHEKLKYVSDFFGFDLVGKHTISSCSQLSKALLSYKDTPPSAEREEIKLTIKKHFAEMTLMIDLLAYHLGFPYFDEVYDIYYERLDELLRRACTHDRRIES